MASEEILRNGSLEIGISLSDEQIKKMLCYASELKKWNQKINLTSITEEKEVIIKHFLDSITYIGYIPHIPDINVIDIGSGAGFPAIPIAISHNKPIAIAMVESSHKKASFLRHIIRLLKLTGITVIDRRVEDIRESAHQYYDVVTARAFAEMREVITVGLPLLKPGGIFIMSRGPEESFQQDEDLIAAGVDVVERREVVLPKSDYRRAIWVFRKGSVP